MTRKVRRFPLISVTALAILALAVALGGGCRKAKPAAEAAAPQSELGVPVTVVPAALGSLAETIEVQGTVKALDEVSIGTTMPDKITWLVGRAGATVKAGQVVARMDTGDLDASVAQASALVEGARVAVEQARQGHTFQDVSLQNNIQTAENRLQLARTQVAQAQTARDLLARGVEDGIAAARTQVAQAESGVQQARIAVDQARLAVSQTEVGATSGVAVAEAAVRQAEASYEDIKRGARTQQRGQAEEAVRQAELAAENARTDLERLSALLQAGAASQQTVDAARLQHDLAVSRVQQARQSLSLTNEGATAQQLEIARQQIEQARANLANARSGDTLVEQRRQSVSAAEENVKVAEQSLSAAQIGLSDAENKRLQVENAARDIENARKAVEAAEIARRQADAGSITLQVDEKEIARALAQLKSAQASVALYSAQRAKRILVTPVDGRISVLNSDVGEIAPQGSPLMTIVTDNALEFEATVSELDVSRVLPGDTVDVAVDGATEEGKTVGRVVSVLPAGDASSRMFTIKIGISADSGIKPGMFARGWVRIRENANAVVIPKDALVESDGTMLVYVVTDGLARRQVVKTGIEGEGQVEIVDGVAPGDQIVVQGKESLSDGIKVEVTTGTAESDGSPAESPEQPASAVSESR